VKLFFRKIGNIYHLDSGDDSHIKNGEIVSAEIKRPRNYKFHKKYFALLNYAFSIWEPEEPEFKSKLVNKYFGKNFDRFREDIICLAGYYDIVPTINGQVRPRAKSISFGRMDEDEFHELYSKTIDVILKHVLHNYTHEDIDRVVEEIIGFDS
jgi:hypothetical protein